MERNEQFQYSRSDHSVPVVFSAMRKREGPLSGRRREAARNDIEILDAAREVFLADPSAPISAVAARAKVGISALYRRYPSKDDLLRELARDGLARYIAELEAALADDRDPWTVYTDCLTRILDGGSQALAQRLAGTFTPTPDLSELAQRASALAAKVHAESPAPPGAPQGRQPRRRYLAPGDAQHRHPAGS